MKCPECNAELKSDARHVGKVVSCPKCSARFTVPPPTPVPSPAEPKVEVPVAPPLPASVETKVGEIEGSGSRASNRKTSSFAKYKTRFGARSVVFQGMLFTWTAFMLFVGGGLCIFFALNWRRAITQPPQELLELAEESPEEAIAIGNLGEAVAGQEFWCCGIIAPFLFWLFIALPLLIAAIATMQPEKDKVAQERG